MSAPLAPGGVLGLDGQVHCLLLRQIIAGPQTIEQVETEVLAQGLLDDLTVALAGPCGAHFDRSQDIIVNGPEASLGIGQGSRG